ncbi:uncharacterized protein LOC124364669 [Homalodisca vitripennis]|uniref:uncharacterized protein LOC124364669 n=1 Tax=Homalodisca vitripennis TaxID=197043 RepID=UPI001EEB0146|nr:uncharacterized protein LOC124364669 [Homalodisca vitripennis]
MISTISMFLLGISIIYCLKLVTSFEGLTGKQLARIRTLKDHTGCRDTYYENGTKEYKMPWFCVRPSECTKKWDLLIPPAKPRYAHEQTSLLDSSNCKDRWFNNGYTECCFIGNLEEFGNFDLADWPKMSYDYNEQFWESTRKAVNAMYMEDNPRLEGDWLFHQLEICAMYPVGVNSNSTLYTPHFCVDKPACDEAKNKSPVQGINQETFQWCEPTKNPYDVRVAAPRANGVSCCHPNAITNSPSNSSFAFRTFPTYSRYAPGFRAALQCELYSKNVCNDVDDMCPYRILYKNWTESAPMEAYHQAMIGIKKPRVQVFFCQGALVSRQFILSAAYCGEYDYTKANLVLLGDYDTRDVGEPFSDELITYIVEHMDLPPGPRKFVHLDTDFYHSDIMLFKLWRTITFSAFRRPACIVHESHGLEWPKWITGTYGLFTGYASPFGDEGWSNNVKKFILEEVLYHNKLCIGYYGVNDSRPFPMNESVIGEFCATVPNSKFQKEYDLQYPSQYERWGPCKFDTGGAFTYLMTVPYCQLVVTGILSQPPLHCTSQRPHLFRRILSNVLWIERIIYKDDFDIFGFDMSWPTCDRHNWQFIYMTFMNRKNNQWTVK